MLTVSVDPTLVVPVMAGTTVFVGIATIAAVAAVSVCADPCELVAVIRHKTAVPVVAVHVADVAPEMSALLRRHWYVSVGVGLPVVDPPDSDNTVPVTGAPTMVGVLTQTGTVSAAATGPTDAEATGALVPAPFVAATETEIFAPSSAITSV